MRHRGSTIARAALWPSSFFLFAACAFCDQETPVAPYVQKTENGRFLFVMLQGGFWGAPGPADPELRKRFPQSGLYAIDGSRAPLWTVDWGAAEVILPEDGIHLVRLGPWPNSYDEEAFSFHERGKLVRRYSVRELILFCSLLPHSVSHFRWLSRCWLQKKDSTVHVVTLQGDRMVFDVATGRRVKAVRPLAFTLAALLAILVAGHLLFSIRARARTKRGWWAIFRGALLLSLIPASILTLAFIYISNRVVPRLSVPHSLSTQLAFTFEMLHVRILQILFPASIHNLGSVSWLAFVFFFWFLFFLLLLSAHHLLVRAYGKTRKPK